MAAQLVGTNNVQRPSPAKKVQHDTDPSASEDRIGLELQEFWANAWGPYMKPPPDGMHPKCLAAKILNDVLGVNGNKYRYQDRDGTNAMLEHLEHALQDAGVMQPVVPGVPPRRVLGPEALLNAAKFRKQLEEEGGLKNWARATLLTLPNVQMAAQEQQQRASLLQQKMGAGAAKPAGIRSSLTQVANSVLL